MSYEIVHFNAFFAPLTTWYDTHQIIKTSLFNIPNESLYDYSLIKSKLQNLATKIKIPYLHGQFTM